VASGNKAWGDFARYDIATIEIAYFYADTNDLR
jgi:hypothetical protein